MTQVPASSHGSFNGGTITTPLVVSADPTGGVNLLRLQDSLVAHHRIIATLDNDGAGNGANFVTVESGGTGEARLTVQDDTNDGYSELSTVQAAQFYARTGTSAATHVLETGTDGGGTVRFAVLAGGGIFTAPPVPATQAFVSGAGAQLSTTRDVRAFTPVTFNPGAATTATCLVEVSPDNVTYYALWTETVPAGVALDGTIIGLCVYVPAAWRLRLTVNAQAVLGTTTYY